MVDWWEENGVPTYIVASAYVGIVGKKKKKSGTPAKGGHPGNDLNELLKLAGRGGMIQ